MDVDEVLTFVSARIMSSFCISSLCLGSRGSEYMALATITCAFGRESGCGYMDVRARMCVYNAISPGCVYDASPTG